MHMWHHVTNHLIISNDKDFNSENRIKLRVRDTDRDCNIIRPKQESAWQNAGSRVWSSPLGISLTRSIILSWYKP
jgi:hypothetical protein